MLTAAAFAALVAGTVAEMWNPPPYRRWPVLTLTVAALVLLTFVAQSLAPNLLSVLSRDPKMLSSGEIWRAVTALFAQDGGTSGLLFDLFWLLVLGTAAERRFTRTGWLVVFFLGGVIAEFLSLYWEPHGAGSSIACFALAGALCADWREGRWRWWRAGFGLAGSAAAAILLLENDIRGIGFLVGLVIGWVFAARAALVEGRAIEMPAERPNVVSISGTDTFH
jgi:membrane associated rhomboid family serine protease